LQFSEKAEAFSKGADSGQAYGTGWGALFTMIPRRIGLWSGSHAVTYFDHLWFQQP
jgi:hypothetical protein